MFNWYAGISFNTHVAALVIFFLVPSKLPIQSPAKPLARGGIPPSQQRCMKSKEEPELLGPKETTVNATSRGKVRMLITKSIRRDENNNKVKIQAKQV